MSAKSPFTLFDGDANVPLDPPRLIILPVGAPTAVHTLRIPACAPDPSPATHNADRFKHSPLAEFIPSVKGGYAYEDKYDYHNIVLNGY